jgi:hypothetical protein
VASLIFATVIFVANGFFGTIFFGVTCSLSRIYVCDGISYHEFATENTVVKVISVVKFFWRKKKISATSGPSQKHFVTKIAVANL